ncbi:MAG: Gfo/Idh/MocA family oxidoreductase [Chitinophagaceae bacterium]
MKSINWGTIGCGDVTEVKSGPAFNKVNNSRLAAVMRRDAARAKDYADRHSVPKWYTDAHHLIADPEINAVYVATPPAFHEQFTIAALRAGKPVYVEKPLALNEAGCINIAKAAKEYNIKLSVAHYRRALPLFTKVREMLEAKIIGDIRFVNLQIWQPAESDIIVKTDSNWRVDPSLSGGGLFHDLAPHQLDLMLYYFGKVDTFSGFSANQAGLYKADDIVSGEMRFENGVFFKGLWCFSVAPPAARDNCEIVGSEGMIRFSFFGTEYSVSIKGKEEKFRVENPPHVQQPMIAQVVKYFLGQGPNPCSAEEATEVMRIMDRFTASAK